MPPTLRCPTAIPSVSCTNHLRNAGQHSSRFFSTTPRNDGRPTRARRAFFRWLGTKGMNFQEQLKGSTNYLGAYDNFGNLRRVVEAKREEEIEKLKEEAAKAAGKPYTPPKPRPAPKKETMKLKLFTPKGMPEGTTDERGNRMLQDKYGRVWLVDQEGNRRLQDPSLESADDISGQVRDGEEAAVALPPEKTRDLIPFPQNKHFVSQPVLSSKYRQKIWEAVMLEGKTVREVSAEHRVEMSRVGAIVRLLEVEKEWERIGKPRAIPYFQAVMDMLPKTLYIEEDVEEGKGKPHESINDLPVHRATGQQIFHPTSESRHFTRRDAAKVFDERLLPADDRIPHPELVAMHKEVLEGLSKEERLERAEARQATEDRKRANAAARQAKIEACIKRVDTGRWEYRFTEISVDDAGKDGRGHRGTGWRYGAPLMDRSRGAVKIPTAVES